MSLFNLAYLQLKREGKLDADNFMELLWDRAEKIGNYMSKQSWSEKLRERKVTSKKLTFEKKSLVKIANR